MGSEAINAPAAVYQVGGRCFETTSPGFGQAVAQAHALHGRPLCLCQVQGVPMYVSRLAGSNAGYVVKRMPDTGSHHAPGCPSYEPPAELSGLGQVLGSAITEDPATGETNLRLDFALSKIPGRQTFPPASADGNRVTTDGTRLSLRGLLHYLWDQAELTRWHSGFAGKRNWGIVRKHLLQAAQNKFMNGAPLLHRLYVPEPFAVDHRAAINQRRLAQWAATTAEPGRPVQLKLLIAEVKEIVPARYGHKAVVKHVPDQAFALDEPLFRRLGRHFQTELALWGASDRMHLLMAATFSVSAAGIPTIIELSLMPVSEQWLPVEDTYELELVERLTRDGRSFIKGLRYNLPPATPLASAVLTDVHASQTLPMFITRRDEPAVQGEQSEHPDTEPLPPSPPETSAVWVWHVSQGAMPPLPARSASIQHHPFQHQAKQQRS